MEKRNLFAALCLTLASAALLLAGCDTGSGKAAATESKAAAPENKDVALIESPQIGDIYAAEISSFSAAEFGSSPRDRASKTYGLMKVVEVDAEKVVLVTEDAGSDTPAISKQDIIGDLSDITFDEAEKIDVIRSELRNAYESGRIYRVRR